MNAWSLLGLTFVFLAVCFWLLTTPTFFHLIDDTDERQHGRPQNKRNAWIAAIICGALAVASFVLASKFQ